MSQVIAQLPAGRPGAHSPMQLLDQHPPETGSDARSLPVCCCCSSANCSCALQQALFLAVKLLLLALQLLPQVDDGLLPLAVLTMPYPWVTSGAASRHLVKLAAGPSRLAPLPRHRFRARQRPGGRGLRGTVPAGGAVAVYGRTTVPGLSLGLGLEPGWRASRRRPPAWRVPVLVPRFEAVELRLVQHLYQLFVADFLGITPMAPGLCLAGVLSGGSRRCT